MRPLRAGGVRSLVLPADAAGEWHRVLGDDETIELERVVPLDEVLGRPFQLGLLERGRRQAVGPSGWGAGG